MITTIIDQIATACATLAATAVLLSLVKRTSPITRKDATVLWKLHKQNSTCKSHKMQPLTTKKGKITGFQCKCGYRYTQKRSLLSRNPKATS